jgi:hypothetical protein
VAQRALLPALLAATTFTDAEKASIAESFDKDPVASLCMWAITTPVWMHVRPECLELALGSPADPTSLANGVHWTVQETIAAKFLEKMNTTGDLPTCAACGRREKEPVRARGDD